MPGQIVPEIYPLSPAGPDFRCVGPDCDRDGENGVFRGEPHCQEHLAEIMATEELRARIDSRDLTIRVASHEGESPLSEVLAWAKATGRTVDVSVIVRVAEEPSKRGCEGVGPRHGGTPRDALVAGHQRFLCDWCEQDMRTYDAQVTRRAVVAS